MAADKPSAGMKNNMMMRMPSPKEASTSVPNRAASAVRSKLASVRVDCSMDAGSAIDTAVRSNAGSILKSARRIWIPNRPVNSGAIPITAATACDATVAQAAPATPSGGTAPQPKMRTGSNTAFNTTLAATTMSGKRTSPAPCRID